MENVDFVHKNKRFGQKQYSNAVLMCSFSVFYFCFCLHVLGFLLLSLSLSMYNTKDITHGSSVMAFLQ